MKLRIQGNSLRLRLTRTEVARLQEQGHVESRIDFAAGHSLVYSIEGSPSAVAVTASFDGRSIAVSVPASALRQWAESDEVSIASSPDDGVQLLIEKDFQCLHKPEQRDADAYPNPLAS